MTIFVAGADSDGNVTHAFTGPDIDAMIRSAIESGCARWGVTTEYPSQRHRVTANHEVHRIDA